MAWWARLGTGAGCGGWVDLVGAGLAGHDRQFGLVRACPENKLIISIDKVPGVVGHGVCWPQVEAWCPIWPVIPVRSLFWGVHAHR